jgi:uncharacterized protein YjbI with pentapeptide repeats
MADEKHLEILNSGVENWNHWIRTNPNINVDLTGADLWNRNLIGINLSDVTLDKANLSDADLSGSNLSKADLRGTNLCDANLKGANLKEAQLLDAGLLSANLSYADISEADLSGSNLKYAKLKYSNLNKTWFLGSDLSGANLRGASLIEANLSKASLNRAVLIGTNLSKANLEKADLRDADLTEANLIGANLCHAKVSNSKLIWTMLSSANLHSANLENANLSFANLHSSNLSYANFENALCRGTNFSNARLENANMNNADFGETIFHNVSLVRVKGLELCNFYSLCCLDYLSLKKSGKLPIGFLKGCGLSDGFINNYLDLDKRPYLRYSIFISCCKEDVSFAQKIYMDLQDNGIRCWYLPEIIKEKQEIIKGFQNIISTEDRLLLIISENSNKTDWLEHKVKNGFLADEKYRNDTFLYPILLDGSLIRERGNWAKFILNSNEIGDFTNWKDPDSYKKALDKLLKHLRIRTVYVK